MKHVIALSGGKDSTALALGLKEREPRDYIYICTPTGNELPEMFDHWRNLEGLLGAPIIRLKPFTDADGLLWLIRHYRALPNWRQRWCTRQLKIEPALAWLAENTPCVYYVGLRADLRTLWEGGKLLRGEKTSRKLQPLDMWDTGDDGAPCRVCRL